MSIIEYKGYQGEVDVRDNKIFIKVLHIDDFVSTECDSAHQVNEEFQSLVDEYIETCSELGRNPNKPFKGTFNVRVSPALHRQAVMAATKEKKSLNSWISEAIDEKLGSEEKKLQFASHAISILSHFQPANPWLARFKGDISPSIYSVEDIAKFRGEHIPSDSQWIQRDRNQLQSH